MIICNYNKRVSLIKPIISIALVLLSELTQYFNGDTVGEDG